MQGREVGGGDEKEEERGVILALSAREITLLPMDDTKPYHLTFEPRPHYLVARVSGEADSVAISLAYWAEVAAECRARGMARVLVIEELKQKPTPFEVFEVASRLREVGMGGIVIAFVDTDLDQLPENLFGETVATNRGLVGKVFNSVADAEAWLEARARLQESTAA